MHGIQLRYRMRKKSERKREREKRESDLLQRARFSGRVSCTARDIVKLKLELKKCNQA